MSRKRERPSRQTEANTKPVEVGRTYLTADARQNLAAMKRRRNAALRCEPLASGSRDPQFGWGW
jgi:hypothetical protein